MTTSLTHPASPESAEAATPSGPGSGESNSPWQRLALWQQRFPLLQLAITVLAFAFGALTIDGFGTAGTLKSILILTALVGLAGIGQTLVVLIGGVDMSVANFIVFGAVMVTQIAVMYSLHFWIAFAIMVPVALILGGLVGWLCHRFSVDPLVATLAMGSLALGVVQVQSEGVIAGGAPEWLTKLTSQQSTTFGLPIPPLLVIWGIVIVLMWVFLHKTVAGRRLQAAGANPVAAGYSLIRLRTTWILVFAFSALAASLAGVMLAAFAGTVTTAIGGPYLFQSLAAVVVGGTVLGGPGDYTRTVGGALMLMVVSTVMVGHGFTTADQQILYGVIIILAMIVYGRDRKLKDRV
ncbi:ABC transporter permease [Citricoccus sp. GCM10030269]|uniref:ABC transporter permease n=1 Tax=Citricoccus sp. GCM10030269 TaxID=3273388 RepID=UPI0036105B88